MYTHVEMFNSLTNVPQTWLHACCYVQLTMSHLMHYWTLDEMCLSLLSSRHTFDKRKWSGVIGLTIVTWYVRTFCTCGVGFLWHSLFLVVLSDQLLVCLLWLCSTCFIVCSGTVLKIIPNSVSSPLPPNTHSLSIDVCTCYVPSSVNLCAYV